jgi:hypothetical protein
MPGKPRTLHLADRDFLGPGCRLSGIWKAIDKHYGVTQEQLPPGTMLVHFDTH